MRPFYIHLKTYIWDRFDVIIEVLSLRTLGLFLPYNGCGSLLFINSNNYLKLKLFTMSIPFPRLMWLWLSQSKGDSLFFKQFTFWLCILGNVLWLGIVTLIQIKNISFLDHGCISFIVWFSTLLIMVLARLNEALKAAIKESELTT